MIYDVILYHTRVIEIAIFVSNSGNTHGIMT